MYHITVCGKTIKKIVPNKTSSVPTSIRKKDDKYSGNSKEMANEFNNYFTSIGNDLGSKFSEHNYVKCPCNSVCSDQYDHIRTVNKFKFSAISADFVLDQICKIVNHQG